jgi:hypothetical protein
MSAERPPRRKRVDLHELRGLRGTRRNYRYNQHSDSCLCFHAHILP